MKPNWRRWMRGARLLITHPKPPDFSRDDEIAMTEVIGLVVAALLIYAVISMALDYLT